MKIRLPISILALMVTSFIASAQSQVNAPTSERQAKAQARFLALDSNHDGKLSYVEMQNNPEHRERFEKSDLNHDGGLSPEEIKLAAQKKMEKRQEHRAEHREKVQAVRAEMIRLDVNQDKALTRAEIGTAMPKLLENFTVIDGNKDGKITREEMKAARAAMRLQQQPPAK